MTKMSKDTESKISQLQMLEQSLNNLLVQRQQFSQQMLEVDSALEEIKDTNQAYKIVGNIMVATDKDKLEKDLLSRKEMLELRIKTIEKQETKFREKASEIQADVMKEIKSEK